MTSLLKFREVFKSTHCAVIGMIHVPALPGTPFNKMKCSQIVETACEEAEVYKKCGVDGVLVENMFDIPYVKPNQAGPELTAFMARVCTEVKRILPSLPCGVQILAGNNKSALAVAAATEVKAEATVPVLLGSGITESNIQDFSAADAVIVGSSFKHGNAWSGTLNGLQVQAFMEKIHMLRQTL